MASFDVKIKGVSNVQNSVKALFKKIVGQESTLEEIGSKIVFLTQGTLRTGKSPNVDGGNPKPQKPISKGWANRKEKLKAVNSTSEFYRKGKSNLTFTGQLIDSIDYEIKKKADSNSIIISAKGDRKPYKGLKGKSLDGEIKNEKVVESLKEKGFDVFGKTRQMVVAANKIVRTAMVSLLRDFNKK